MTKMKSLAKQTAVYGLSNMLGKFLNWCLVPLYTYVLTNSAEYGVVTNLYAWTALLLVILTYGMETGFFRFANKEGLEPKKVYSTILWCVFGTSVLFACAGVLFSDGIAGVLGYSAHPEYVSIMCVIVAMDAFGCIPFAYLRYENKALRFALLKLLMILVNIGFNLFFLVACPKIMETAPEIIDWFYKPDYGVGYVFVSNLFSTIFVTLMLTPQICKAGFSFDKALLREVLKYSLPLLVLGVAGIMNQTIDKIIFPYLLPDRADADAQLGIYGACFKVAMVMMVFTQAFRYAYEPFVFAQNKGGDKKKEYSDAMKFFIIFSWLIFLGMVFYIDILK
ncbi:MAG: lipopolysaccharide biosynthesis protein, partial [Paludibacteraceae bacterium]|nr:lipopolysaccharide biosynthesis protein [Paludibacteraceae bacterium]